MKRHICDTREMRTRLTHECSTRESRNHRNLVEWMAKSRRSIDRHFYTYRRISWSKSGVELSKIGKWERYRFAFFEMPKRSETRNCRNARHVKGLLNHYVYQRLLTGELENRYINAYYCAWKTFKTGKVVRFSPFKPVAGIIKLETRRAVKKLTVKEQSSPIIINKRNSTKSLASAERSTTDNVLCNSVTYRRVTGARVAGNSKF